MCGIFGIFGFEDETLMDSMRKILYHRGPDEFGKFTDKLASIGNTRLSIIDLKTGKQPIYNEEGSVCVVANCEIYNFKELRKKLEEMGHKFYTETDVEAIAHAYEEYNDEFPKYLHGAFAIALYDLNKKKLILTRDHFGINPLYYYYSMKDNRINEFIFASEIKAILESKLPRQINKKAIYDFFTFMYVPGEETLLNGIFKLLPAHQIIVTEEGVEKKRYWNLEIKNGKASKETIIPKLRFLLEQAVKARMMSDVPIGLLLSGGVDSSTVLAFMSKYSNSPIKTYSVVFDALDDKNTRYIADVFNTDHHEVPLTSEHMELLPKIVYHTDCLIADPTNIPIYLIANQAKKDVKVVLTGEGADDQLMGYNIFKVMLNSEFINMHRRAEKRFMRYVSLLRDDFSTEEKEKLLFPNGRKENYNSYYYLRKYFNSNTDICTQVSKIIFENYLPHDLLNKVNSMCLAHGVEGRVPFLDLNLVKTTTSLIPNKLKIKDDVEKWILRESVKGIVPDTTRLAPKKPFSVPMENLFGKDFVDVTFNTIAEAGLFNKIFDKNFVEKILDKNRKYKSYSRQVYSLLTFGLWYDIFLNKEISFSKNRF